MAREKVLFTCMPAKLGFFAKKSITNFGEGGFFVMIFFAGKNVGVNALAWVRHGTA
jgi:hypothetical protein